VWKGPEGTPAERLPRASGAACQLDGTVVTIDDSLAVTHRPLTPAEADFHASDPTDTVSTSLESTVCTIGERIFPIAACH
jgi:hypothetical protein